jgi:thiamine pyrophosphate-dependent acetolactate synthase large subunit-like protein
VPVIQVDVRGEQIGRRVPVDVPLVGTVADTIDALLPLITAKTDSAHLDRMTAHYRRARARLDRLADERRGRSPLHPQSVAVAIDRLAAADAVFTADVRTDRHELSLPPKLTYGEIKGFTLYATRTILSGGGDELIELAKSNLRDLEVE